jgi:putative protease
LYALRQIPEILQIGIAALKIEGRYKDAEYVALTTRAYRQAVDEAWAGRAPAIDAASELQLEQVYSRGLGPFFLTGTDHQKVVRGRAPRHRGVLMGTVVQASHEGVEMETAEAHRVSPLKPGDGIVFDAAQGRSPEEAEEGGRIFQVFPRGDRLELRFGNGVLDPGRIRRGDLVWRTHDPEIDKAARAYLEPDAPVHKQPVSVKVVAREGEPLVTEWSAGRAAAKVESQSPLGTARNRALDREFLREQFGRLGNTPYQLADLELEIAGSPFAPSSLLNQVRREAVEKLQRIQGAPKPITVHTVAPPEPAQKPPTPAAPELHLLVRTPEQLDAAIDLGPASITLDYLDLYGLRPSLDRVRAAGLQPRVASPRILKPGEARIVDFLRSCDCPILVRSAGLLDVLRHTPHASLIGDFSLNAANALTAREFLELGLSLLTPAHDLNAAQVATLAVAAGAERIETVVYQHLPVFHTEHCVFCRFLSTGTSYRDCGRPCETHTVALRDDAGRAHPVMADVGCRNTVFGAEAQQAAAHLDEWRAAGISRFRLEFAHESGEQVVRVTRAFEDTLAGRRSARDLVQTLQRIAPGGATEGSLFVPADYLTLPVLQ